MKRRERKISVVVLRCHSWWPKINQHWRTVLVILTILTIVIALIIVSYRFDWTGFNGNNKSGKTLWDWLQLLIIPFVLAVGGLWFSQVQKDREQKTAEQQAQTERQIAQDDQQEATLQEYINKMSELLLDRDLCKSTVKDEVRKVARVRTLTVLPRLNGKRKGLVLQFLYEAQLINKGNRIVDLTGADFVRVGSRLEISGPANLSNADLTEARLTGANLLGADLRGADLTGVFLEWADLRLVCLEGANLLAVALPGADLSGANLTKAKVTEEQLKEAKSLQGAIMPDGSKHQ